MLLPVAFVLLQAMPRLKLWAAPIGFVIMCLSLSLSSFATTTTHLIVSQGVAYGIGASLAYAPTIVFMDDWFVQRKGLAFGIMWVSDTFNIKCCQTQFPNSDRRAPDSLASFFPSSCNGCSTPSDHRQHYARGQSC